MTFTGIRIHDYVFAKSNTFFSTPLLLPKFYKYTLFLNTIVIVIMVVIAHLIFQCVTFILCNLNDLFHITLVTTKECPS